MLLGLIFSVLVVAVGLAVLRVCGVLKGPAALGIAPAAGLAALAIATTWPTLLGAPPLVAAALFGALGASGLFLMLRELTTARWIMAVGGEIPAAFGVLAAALLIPVAALGVGFAGVDVPLSSHDGAYHVEVIQALRTGSLPGVLNWYPPGFHASVAAFLQLMPWIDSASGAFGASLALSILVPLVVFGLGCAVWRNPLFASAGALVTALTFQFPYYANFWGGWPLTTALIIVVGLWAVALEYVQRPAKGWTVVAAVLAAGVLLTHGTEVYTATIGLVIIVISAGRKAPWKRIARDVPIAVGAAVLLALPYLPTLLAWAHGGGAVDAAYAGGAPSATATPLGAPPTNDLVFFWVYALSTGMIIDAPLRAALLVCGIWWAFRNHTGRKLVAIAMAFFAVDVLFTCSAWSSTRLIFALTYPWGQSYRLDTMVAATAALLQGAGAVAIARWLATRRRANPNTRQRSSGLSPHFSGLTISTLAVVGSVFGMIGLFSALVSSYNTYSPDDAAAMAWLRENARPGDIVANDGSTDGGIWAPYKAGLRILKPRASTWAPAEQVNTILDNVASLQGVAEARDDACALGVRYVYHGASGTAWEPRHFPTLEEMRQSDGLEQVFASGDAVIFRTRLACAA